MSLVIKFEKYEDIQLMSVMGRIIDVDSKKLKKKFESLYKKDYPVMIINITDAEFIDSYGLGVIVYYHTLMQKSGKKLYLVDLTPSKESYMKRLLELTQLEKVFNVVSSYSEIKIDE